MARSTHRRCHAKLTALAATHVTEALATTMNAELKALGYKRRVQPDLTGRTDLGVTKVTLRLKDISAKASKVLSEGEQRALGLAMFLAELESLPHTSTVVFDDPSTSLDHVFRQAIARRLVTLSETRQVLVLTHDAVFLTELAMALQRAGSSANYKTIGWDDSPGLVSEGLTWTTMDTKARLADLRERVKALNTIDGSYPDDELERQIAAGYSSLRGPVERAIRGILETERPDDGVFGEEYGAQGPTDRQWIIDPIDGTANFAHGDRPTVATIGDILQMAMIIFFQPADFLICQTTKHITLRRQITA